MQLSPSRPEVSRSGSRFVLPAVITVGALLGSLVTATSAAAADDVTAPAPITKLATSSNKSRVKLDWTSSKEKDLAGYLVYRSASATGTFTKLTVVPRTSSDYSDKDAPSGVPSYYQVTAVDESGNEAGAVGATGTRKDGTAPGVPQAARVTGAAGSYAIDWADNTEGDLAGYLVARATKSGGSFTKLTPSPLATSEFADSSSTAGATPYYKISAIDFSGNASSAVTVTLPDAAAPDPVRSIKVTADTSKVKLDWSSNTESDLAGYLVYRSGSPSGDFVKITATPRKSSDYTDTTSPAGVAAHYRVVAVDKSGNESVPVAATATRRDGDAPAAPASLTALFGPDGVALDWADNSESDLAGYVVSRATSSGGSYSALTPSPVTSSNWVDSTAPGGATAYYKVTAVDISGNTSASASASAAMPDLTAPADVRSVKVTADTSRIKLDWSSNTEKDLAGYLVYRSDAADGEYEKLTATPRTSSDYSDTTSTPGVAAFYRIVAADKSGNESAPVAATGTRKDAVAPATPAAFSAVTGTEGVTLDWADNSETDLAGYVVARAATPGGSYTTLTAAPITASTLLDPAAPTGKTSYYKVTAVDASGNVSPAAAADAAMADLLAPETPTDLAASGTKTGISLTWARNTETDLAGYLVSRSDSEGGEYTALTAAPVTEAAYLDSAAPAERSSFYRVVAVDKSGNTSAAATTEGTPADTIAPAQPADLVAAGSDTSIALDWADNSEADLAGYLVSRSDTADGTYTVLTPAPTTDSAFTDPAAPAGVTSYYRVTAVDASGNASTAAAADSLRTVAHVPVVGADITVAQDGSGDYTSLTAALAAAPTNAATPFTIGIKAGTYRELLTVSKPNIVLLGATPNASDVVITYDNASGTVKPDGSGTYGTTGSATVLIKGSNVTTRNLTIENAYQETGSGSEQAVALKTSGDRLVFDNVRLLGDQDTLYVDSPTQGALARSYFTNSYIEGDVDFIFGRGTAVFDRSTLKAATRGSATNNGYVTAASTDKSLTYGYLITDSTIVSDAPAQSFSLGRPWQPSGDVNAVAQVVIRNTNLPAAIKSSPWTDMTSNFSWRDARLAEYQNIGAGAGVNADRPQLSDADAAKYTKFTYLEGSDGWNPTGQAPPAPPADLDAPAAPAALVATAGDSKAVITWAANTEADLAGYNLYRTITATPDAGSTRLNGALLTGTTYSDVRLANDTAYGYTVTAVDKAGNESAASAASTVTPVGVPLPAHDILVAADGSGQYTSVQAAVAAAPTGTAAKPTVVAIKPGIYKELVAVSKSYVQLVGTTGDAFDVTLTYDNAAGTSKPDGTGTYGTGGSQSVLVSGSNVTVRNLTIENSFDEAAFTYSAEQAVALKTTGDRLVFDNVRLLGNQDTLLADSPDAPVIARSYFTNSFIQGDVDFIFGRGTAVFDKTTINALSRGSNSNNGYLTAASTSDKNPYGFLITDSTITSNAPAGTFSLGRPWRGWTDGYTKNGVAYNSRGQVTIRNSVLPAAIRGVQPWADMSPNVWTDGRFSEYANTGAGAGMNVNRPQLSDEQAAVSTKFTYLAGADGWNPTGDSARIPVLVTPPVASTDLTAPTDVATVVAKNAVIVTWDAVAGADVAGYAVYRAAAGEAPTKVSGAAPLTGTSYTDPTGIIGTEYQYTVTAVAASGAESPASKPAAGTSVKADILVAADGSGDATTVQAGINLLADNADYTAQGGRVILIKPGTYTGVVTSGNRYGVTLVGSTGKPEDVVLTAAGTGTAATVTLSGKGWSLKNLTVANTNGATTAGAQATALNVSAGDKDVFDNVRFLGDKQTLIVSTANVTTYSRLYFHSVYVEGGSDMILGRAVAVFTNSTFHVLNRPGASLTDSSIAAGSPYGFLIADSTIVTDGAAGSVYLGRPYGTNGKAQVAIRNTELGAGINTAKPWKDWDATTTWTAGRFAEYQNIGPGAVITDPATRPQLAAADAGTYTAQAYLSGADGWNPVP